MAKPHRVSPISDAILSMSHVLVHLPFITFYKEALLFKEES